MYSFPPPHGVALPRETGEKRSGGGVKTIDAGGGFFKSLFSFLFFSVEPRVRIIINIIYNYYYYYLKYIN